MHRTQINLDDWQYLALRERARRSSKSMGQLIRELLDLELQVGHRTRGGRTAGLKSLNGIVKDPGFGGEKHDEVIYGGR